MKLQTTKLLTKGFTLIELMIVVAIVGILASIALPQYSQYVIRGRLTEAVTTLADTRVRLEHYYQDNRTYNGAAICANPPTGRFFTYTCTTTGQGFTLTATGRAAEGVGGFTYTLNDANVRATTAVPSDWGSTSTNCWIVRKGGGCA